MARAKIELKDYGLLIAPNVCRLMVELHDRDHGMYIRFSYALFAWVSAGCPLDYSSHIPRELDVFQQAYLERLFSEHISRWKSYNSHRRIPAK